MNAVHLIKTYCLPTLTYGLENSVLTEKTKDKISVLWNNCCFRHIFSGRELNYVHVRYMLSAVRLSSVCLSVALVHPTQAVELFGIFYHTIDSPGTLLFWCQKSLMGDAPFPLKFAFKVTHPPFKQRNFDQYRLIAPQP